MQVMYTTYMTEEGFKKHFLLLFKLAIYGILLNL
jgi:hypothetical protein